MQSGGGQYGVPDQFVVQRPPPPHMFALSHEMSLSPTTHGHHHLQQHPQHHQQQQPQHHHQQQQQHHHQPQHATHSQHPQLPQHQPQQQPQRAQHQQHQQHAQHQQQQQQQQQQQAMVQQLGLGPDSPEVPSPIASRPAATGFKQQRESLGEDDGGEEEGRGTGGNRWPRQETLALIKIRSEMDANFRDSGLKGPLWEDVSRKLAELGYQRSSKKCKEKFENVHKYYKKTKDGRAGRQDGKNYRFFSQLEALYGGGGGSGGVGGGGGSSSQHGDGGTLMLTAGGSGAAIGGGAEGNLSLQRPAENSSGVQLSSESEDDYDDPGDNDEGDKTRKRKRKEGKMLSKMIYFEGLLKKLVEKQEAMQRKFLEAIERREQERLVREENWKRQEMARTNKEHELRAQEHALAATRDAALVAFLQKVTGQTLTLPPRAPPQAMAAVAPEAQHVEDHQMVEGKELFDPNSKRWPKPEVQALIRLRSQMEPRFQEAGPKGPLWEEISTGMACLGYSRNAKRCKEKWENINKYFRKTKETNKKRPDNAKTCPYFHQLDMLYRKGVLGTPNSKLNKLDDNSDDLMDHPSTRDDSEQDHGRDAEEILAIMPPGDGPSGASTSNGGATHFFSSPGNGSSGDRGSKKVMKQPQILASRSGNGDRASPSVVELNFDGLHRGDGENFSGNDKSMRLEGLVSTMLEQEPQQQEQEQKVHFEESFAGRREQEREMREYERRQQEDYRFTQERARVSSRDTALIALVQKLTAGEPSEFALSAPSSSE